jgi:hypothetical protein
MEPVLREPVLREPLRGGINLADHRVRGVRGWKEEAILSEETRFALARLSCVSAVPAVMSQAEDGVAPAVSVPLLPRRR